MVRYIYILWKAFKYWLKAMGSIWLSKKAFLYFGGAAIILIGGAIVLIAPYNYINFALVENQQRTFEIKDEQGHYPQLEISISVRPANVSLVELGIVIEDNITLDTTIVNFTLNESNLIQNPDTVVYEDRQSMDLPYGNYTITLDTVEGAGLVDVGFKQATDSRLFIFIGGFMNVLGAMMAIGGYFVAGTFLPTDTDTIVEWGYDEEEE